MDKFIVQSNNNTSNKLQGFRTVSHRSRHRSNHTQKNIPSIVAGHQFLQFGYIGPKSGSFPITVIVTHPGFCLKTTHFSANVAFTKLPLQEFAVSLWHLLQKNYSSPSLSLHRESIGLAVIPGKSDIVEVAGFTTASDIFRVSLGFLSEITEEPFSVHPPHT